MALYNSMYHWGSVIVPPGYTGEAVGPAGGNPYGTAHASGGGAPDAASLAAARFQGERLAEFTHALLHARASLMA